jgi:hypothetical protein
MSKREELPVSALPLTLRVVLGSPEGGSNDNPVTPALRIIIEGFDPITVTAPGRIILHPDCAA